LGLGLESPPLFIAEVKKCISTPLLPLWALWPVIWRNFIIDHLVLILESCTLLRNIHSVTVCKMKEKRRRGKRKERLNIVWILLRNINSLPSAKEKKREE
jgi:hypothetical protein